MPDFDFSTLITDRSPEDLQALRDLLAVPMSDWTAEQLTEFNQAVSKGAYNYTDLNRVTACMDYLNERLTAAGYVTGYQRIVVHPDAPEPTEPLPDGYIQLDYIESTGTQYIDTGFKPTQETRVIMDAQMTTINPTDHEWFYGARQASSVSAFGFFWNYSAQKFGATYGNQQRDISSDVNKNDRIIINQDQNLLTFNDVSYEFSDNNFSCPVSLPLLARNTNGTINSFTSAKLYSCQIYDDGVLVRNFVPCQNPSGNVGLYDSVHNQFYGNSGTGAFIAAPTSGFVDLPDGYTQLEYIESSAQQYINTGHTVQSENMQVSIKFAYTGDHSNSCIFGSERSGRYSICPWGPPQLYVGQTTQIPTAYTPQNNEIAVLDVQAKNGILTDTWNNSQVGSHTYTGALNHSDPVYIFGNDIAGQASQLTTMQLYAFTLYDNCNKIREYIPCINSNGDTGLYDLVSSQFFENAGSGDFIAGPIVPEPEPPMDPYTWYEIDVPTQVQMSRYLENVSKLKNVLTLPENTIEAPEAMEGLTLQEANEIETILSIIDIYLVAMKSIVLNAGMPWAISGGPNFYFAI